MQTQRLFEIVYLLLEGESLTASDLAKRLEVSTRTIRRDIEKLSGAGIPVYMTRGKGGGIHLLPNFVLSKSLLNSSEQDEILFALQALRRTGVSGSDGAAVKTHERLTALFQKEDPMDWLEIDFESWGSTPNTKQFFSSCQQGILQQRLLEFDYFASPSQKKSKGTTHRSVEPYRLIFRTNCWYLQAFCLLRGEWRLFKLSRIRNLKLTATSFEKRPLPIDNGSDSYSFPTVHVKLKFSPHAAFRVLDEFPIQQVELEPDGSLKIKADMVDAPWIPSYLLSFGEDVEVIEPVPWRDYIVHHAQGILKKYE